MELKNLVQDWGGFEQLIKDMHDNGSVEVEHDVTLTGKSGATRQIDVLLRHHCPPYTYLTLIECKYWKHKVERANIDVLAASLADLNAAKGVFFTTVGYQQGAEIYAKSMGITIYVVRELTNEEWGLPGKIIDLYLHFLQPTLFEITPTISEVAHVLPAGAPAPRGLEISLYLGEGRPPSSNKIISKHKGKYKTLEDVIDFAAEESINQFIAKRLLINGGEECTRYFVNDLLVKFEDALIVQNRETFFKISELRAKVGIKVIQSRILIDRSENYLYALAVHDCITNEVFSSSRHKKDSHAQWSSCSKSIERIDRAEAVQNGSIISVVIRGYFPREEMDGLIQTPMELLIESCDRM
ncbi:restriction endonuclease [Ectopseudomonas toyotomiensis]|uniref:restriction endonuclease n=1 Tax=Ectopseudomonas toyotomiensis TaxID=554344 RepID=UPI003D110039